MNFSIIIPTYKRQDSLGTMLKSLENQKRLPDEVIVIDDDTLPKRFLQKIEGNLTALGVNFIYHKKDHDVHLCGSSTSRNLGIRFASHEICFIFDDDLILDEDFFEQIVSVWKDNKSEDLIGVGAVIKNNRRRSWLEKTYNWFFGLSGENNWDVNDVGFQSWDDWIKKQEIGYYVHGGVCSYKKNAVEQLSGFTVRSGGRDALEDVDFCLRSKQAGYHFIINPTAKVAHNHSPSGRENSSVAGFKEGYNRKQIFRDHCKKTLKTCVWFLWSSTGWILRQLLVGHFAKGFGMIKGLLSN